MRSEDFLMEVYRRTDQPGQPVSFHDLYKDLGIEGVEAQRCFEALKGEGLLEERSIGHISITPKGIKRVEGSSRAKGTPPPS